MFYEEKSSVSSGVILAHDTGSLPQLTRCHYSVPLWKPLQAGLASNLQSTVTPINFPVSSGEKDQSKQTPKLVHRIKTNHLCMIPVVKTR